MCPVTNRRQGQPVLKGFIGLFVDNRKLTDDRAFAGWALHAVAIRSRLSAPSKPLRGALGGGRLRLLPFQPELVQGTQKQRKSHRASAGGVLCHQLFGSPSAIRTKRAGSGVVSSPCDRGFQQTERRQFRVSSVLGRSPGTRDRDAANGRPD